MTQDFYSYGNARLAAWLDEIREYLEDRQDVRDGSDGVQLPNEEMSLLLGLEDALRNGSRGPNEREKKLLQALSLCHLHCEQLHHEKKHQHTSEEKCPVEKIIWDAIDGCSATHDEGVKP